MPKLVTKSLQRYWRLSRGLTMGAQGVILDSASRVLLVRHAYRPGWHFPGGGVEKGESALAALTREIREEAGILLDDTPDLFGLYTNFRYFPGDHIALFVIRAWRQPHIPPPNREIADQGFFDRSALPDDIHLPVVTRLREVLAGAHRAETWW